MIACRDGGEKAAAAGHRLFWLLVNNFSNFQSQLLPPRMADKSVDSLPRP